MPTWCLECQRFSVETVIVFLRAKKRFKDGKEHCYWSLVENRRVAGGRVVQRQVLYLGEINDGQKKAWCVEPLKVFRDDEPMPTQVAIFPADREAPELECEVIHVKLDGLQLKRPPAMGSLLAGPGAVESIGTGSILGGQTVPEPQGDTLAECIKDTGVLSTD